MTPNFIKHKVRPQDTLCSLASRLKMDEEQLKEFHNTNCGKLDKIWFSNLHGIEYILIPTQYISQHEIEANHEKLLPPPNYFFGFHANKYSVSEIFSNVNQS